MLAAPRTSKPEAGREALKVKDEDAGHLADSKLLARAYLAFAPIARVFVVFVQRLRAREMA